MDKAFLGVTGFPEMLVKYRTSFNCERQLHNKEVLRLGV